MALGSHNSSNRIWQHLRAFDISKSNFKKSCDICLFSQKLLRLENESKNKEEIRYILKFYYQKGKNATQVAKKICLWI